MEYRFQILTTRGLVEHTVTSLSDFSQAPFGYVSYRAESSCECSQQVLDDFWNCIDEVLTAHDLTPTNFIRAVQASVDGQVFGEHN